MVNFCPTGTYYTSNKRKFYGDFREPLRFGIALMGGEIYGVEADW